MEKRFTYDAFKINTILCAKNIGNGAAGRKYTVSDACVCHWRSIKTQLFPLSDKKTLDQGKEEILRLMPVLEYFKVLQNKGLPVTREALMSKAKECARNSNIYIKANCGWCEKFMKKAYQYNER
jgi:hypothetical protein